MQRKNVNLFVLLTFFCIFANKSNPEIDLKKSNNELKI